jgi:tRNA(fMet)-specific endonuclease VapC
MISSVEPDWDTFFDQPWGEPQALVSAQLRAQLERSGRVIGNNDMLIAAHAFSAGAVLVTNNQREFSRITRLICENWQGSAG